MPGMFGIMLDGYFGSVVFPILMLLYRHPDGEWLDVEAIASALGADGGNLLTVFVVESAARLLRIFELFGAAEADRGSAEWRADHAAIGVVFAEMETEVPGFRIRLTPLGRCTASRTSWPARATPCPSPGSWLPQMPSLSSTVCQDTTRNP